MMCPQPHISNQYSSFSTHGTIQLFIDEMPLIDFSDFSFSDCHSIHLCYVPPDSLARPKVWMRVDCICKSLEVPYTGPYEAVCREPKYFVL